MTSVHSYLDTRIFFKECCSLAQSGYETHLVAPDAPDQTRNGVHLHGLQKIARNRLVRIMNTPWSVYRKAQRIDAVIYHFHDPELIPVGLLLKAQGKRVIYDVHEHVPRQIMSKPWIPWWLRTFIAYIVSLIEAIGVHFFDGIVTVTPTIARRFPPHKTVVVQNFPMVSELMVFDPTPYNQRPLCAIYIGAITHIRGIREMLQAIDLVRDQFDVQLLLVGNFDSAELEQESSKLAGWQKVNFLGWQSRDSVARILAQSRVGLVILHPVANYIDSQPNKLFEYMSASIPIIASNFPKWKGIIERTGCGLTVDPCDPRAIARAIEFVLAQPQAAEVMGRRGRAAIERQYNWEQEVTNLLRFYEKILNASTYTDVP